MDHEHEISDGLAAALTLLRNLTLRQRCGLAGATLIVLTGLCWMVLDSARTDLVALTTAEPLTPAALRELEADFRAAGLHDFERSGRQLHVPRSQLPSYEALLPATSTAPEDWASEWERQNERLTPFSSSRAREATREIARARLITGMLRQLPDVQQADVVWDEDEQRGWRDAPRARATVYLMPRPDSVLTLDVIRSVRLAVAGSKKNLDPTDVVVMDLARQITYEGELPVTAGEELLPALRSLAELYRREITGQIAQLDDADVAVHVDLPRFFKFLADHPGDAAVQLSTAAPGLLRVVARVPVDSGLSTGDDTRLALQTRIATLTGIGQSAADRSERIVVAFEQATSAPSAPVPTVSIAGWTTPLDWRWWASAGGGLLLIAGALLWRWSRPRSASCDAGPVPAFQHVGRSTQEWTATMLANFDDLSQCSAAVMRQVYAHATPRRWAVALRGSSVDLAEHLVRALDPLDADELRQQCEQLGPVTIGEIETSRQRIVDSARPAVT